MNHTVQQNNLPKHTITTKAIYQKLYNKNFDKLTNSLYDVSMTGSLGR